MNALKPIAKAIVGGLTAGAAAGVTAALDERISMGEWWAIALAFLTGLGVVYAVPNQPPTTYDARHDKD